MSSFFGGSSSSSTPSTGTDMNQVKEQMKQQIQQELALANAQQLVNKMNENCFEKCVKQPGPSLTGNEEQCLSRCMTLYSAAFDQISQKYIARVFKQRAAAGAGNVQLST